MSKLDTIRAATLGRSSSRKTKLVTINDEAQVEVRQPSVKARGEIFKRAGAGANGSKVDLAELQVTAVIECTFEPGTPQRVFTDADRAALFDAPAGGFVDQLAEAALELLNVNQEDLEKNS